MAVGSRVTQLRQTRELAPSVLARLAGMDANYLWRIEAGRQNLSLRNVARLAKAFEITLSELFAGIDVTSVDTDRRPYAKRVRTD